MSRARIPPLAGANLVPTILLIFLGNGYGISLTLFEGGCFAERWF